MPAPKVVVVKDELSEITNAIRDLHLEGYYKIELHFHGSQLHARMGIRPDHVLIKALRTGIRKRGAKREVAPAK